MQIWLLGPLEVRAADGAELPVLGTRLRALVITLALEPGRIVSMETLVDAIWGDEPPAGAVNALQALVSRLRRALPGIAIEAHSVGYRLAVEPDAVDVTSFERLVRAGRSALPDDPATAARLFREALGLWRGPALQDVAGTEYFRAQVAHLSELRLTALEARAEAELRLGLGAGLTSELTALVAEYPLRERLVAMLMRALCVAGRSAEALAVYERAREALATELGADPSPELSALHTAVLRGEVGGTVTPVPEDSAVAATGTKGVERGPDEKGADPPARTNLRAGLTSFVGRDGDVLEVRKLVEDYRLTTLTGPGGSGKTRISIEVGRSLLDQVPDGVWIVELASITDGADVPQAVLTAMGLREQALIGWTQTDNPKERLAAALSTRGSLLILDNCEHLIGEVTDLTEQLLGECPQLRILATSREPLGIIGEAIWPVEPLALPPDGADFAEATSYDAVRLLTDRARAARPGFTVDERTGPALVRLCRALDGMPLAIELAAARLRTMTAEQLAARLDDRFRLLTGGGRRAMPRQQTLRGVVDWSWELLDQRERALLRRLSVFSGGATAESAEGVCADSLVPAAQVFDLLSALADKSLLVYEEEEPPRFRMLETIKAYGMQRLEEAGERERYRQAHAGYFAELVETADPHLRRADQLRWLARLRSEHDNITAALRGAISAGDAQTAVRLAAGSAWYWWLTGNRATSSELTVGALATPGPVDDESLVTAYAAAALNAMAGLGDQHQATEWLERIGQLTRQHGAHHPLVRFVQLMSLRGDDQASDTDAEGTPELRADDDPWVQAMVQLSVEKMVLAGHRHAEAEAAVSSALGALRELGERWGISFALTALADLIVRRDLAAAHGCYEEAIAVLTEVGVVEDIPYLRSKLAQLRWLLGDPAGCAAAMADAERDAQNVGSPDSRAMVAYYKAELARWSGDASEARIHLARYQEIARHLSVASAIQAMVFSTRGYVDTMDNHLDGARAHHAEALASAMDSGDVYVVGQILVGVADLALHQERPREAARLLAASDAIRGMPDVSLPDVARVEGAARAALGDDEFADASRRGRNATVATAPEVAAATLNTGR
ncbi:BTAD domain-containing putative transcriptional regulator [Phytoactinopolyspora mesophila]|uniref:AfsR/SARP family transcriptional regulator n=1 Tax=Phytoactinopolyspora mesophila TaxID=2650750 RepID=A0A7K3MCY1_9ACTN|nr:AfsR/SARP family transcriptional regulator [Phytoactinopolyspora mesophila]